MKKERKMIGQSYNYTSLSALINQIKSHSLTGQLTGFKDTKTCQLYFKQGELVHAFEPASETSGDDVLYNLMSWETGQLEWQTLPQLPAQLPQTLDKEQIEIFYHTLQLLQQQGKYALQLPDSQAATAAISPQTQATSVLSWPLLPGTPDVQLYQKVADLEVQTLVKELQNQLFSGYITYKLAQANSNYINYINGLLLFEQGRLTTARYAFNNLLHGQAAYDAIFQKNLPLEHIVEVETSLIIAYRGLLGGFSPFSNLQATQSNFKGLQAAFAKQQRSGVIRCRLGGQAEIYNLMSSTQDLGIYSLSSPQSQYWQRLNFDTQIFWQNPQAQLDVFVTREPEQIDTFQVVQLSPNTQLVTLLGRALQKLFELVCQLSAPATALEELVAVAETGSRHYPTLRFFTHITSADMPDFTAPNLTKLQTHLSQIELIATYQYLINNFLGKYLENVGSPTFAELAELSLGPDRQQLEQAGLQLDFLKSGSSLPKNGKTWDALITMPIDPEESETEQAAQESNAFDF